MRLTLNKNIDKQLLKRLNTGDNHAFLSIYDVFAPKIYRFVFYKTGFDKDLAEDLTQETFVKTWDHISSSRKKIKNVQAFVYQIARNLVIDHWRKRGRHTIVPFNDEIENIIENTTNWREEFNKKLDSEILIQSLEHIPTQYREVLLLRFMEELDIKTIGKILKKKTTTTRVLIYRALKSLKCELQKEIYE